MPDPIASPMRIRAAGAEDKLIDEYFGLVSTGTSDVLIAHMRSHSGWQEPGQHPDFHEFTIVLTGSLRVEHGAGVIDVVAGQAVHTRPGEWVRYSTPLDGGAEYIFVCIPAFSPATVHRDD
jgi:ethanolamine utilization protein EutQ